MMISSICFPWMLTVRLVVWPENYLRTGLWAVSFLASCTLGELKGSVGLILANASAMRVTVPIELSTRSFIPLPCFFNSRRAPPLLTPSPVLFPQQSAWAAHGVRSFWKLYRLTVHHSSSVTFSPLALAIFYSAVLKNHHFLDSGGSERYVRHVDPSVLASSLTLHRHPHIRLLFSSRFIYS